MGGRGKAGKEGWGYFFNDAANDAVKRRIMRLTGWSQDSVKDQFSNIWSTLCGWVHDKRRPEDYQQGLDRITISQAILNPEQCLACASLLHVKAYPFEIIPAMKAWEEELARNNSRVNIENNCSGSK